MRQSEGNKTAKRLSAIWRVARLTHGWRFRRAIEGPATAVLAWAARIASPLLLKTASLSAREKLLGGRLCLLRSSITAAGPLGNVAGSAGAKRGNRRLAHHVRKPLSYRHKDQSIASPKAFRAAHRLQQKNRKQTALGKCAAARTKTYIVAAILTVEFKIFLEPDLVGRDFYHGAPRNEPTKGQGTDWHHSNTLPKNKPARKTIRPVTLVMQPTRVLTCAVYCFQ